MLVAWRDNVVAQIKVQRLNPSGTPLWAYGGADAGPSTFDSQGELDVCSDNAGGAYVAYRSTFYNEPDIIVQRLDASGSRLFGAVGHAVCFGSAASGVAISPDGTGGCVADWLDTNTNGFITCAPELRAQHVHPNGMDAWVSGGVLISSGGAEAALPDPTMLRPVVEGIYSYFVWTGADASCHPTSIFTQELLSNGTPVFAVGGLPLAPGIGHQGRAIPCGSDCIVAISGATTQVMRVANNGAIAWVHVLSVSSGGGNTASNGVDGAFAAWYEPGLTHLFVQELDGSGTLSMPMQSPAIQGSPFADATFGDPNRLCIVSDGKLGALIGAAGQLAGAPLPGVLSQGVDWHGRRAFQAAGVQISSPGQSSGEAGGAPGILNDGMFAWGNSNGVWAQQVTLSDLDATAVPPGWAAPLVPRSLNNATTSSVTATALLEGQPTYLNWVVAQRGPNPTPAFQSRVYLDGSFFWGLNVPDGAGTGYYPVLNFNSTISIPGGPHTLTLYSDWGGVPDFSVDEASEGDDVWSAQWVWEPQWVLTGSKLDGPVTQPILGPAPGPLPTGNAHKFLTPAPGGAPNAWVVSDAARRGPTFDPGTGGLTGYGDISEAALRWSTRHSTAPHPI